MGGRVLRTSRVTLGAETVDAIRHFRADLYPHSERVRSIFMRALPFLTWMRPL